MPSDEIQALHLKIDTLMRLQMEQSAQQREQAVQLNALQLQFSQAKGALSFVKWAAPLSVGIATLIAMIWAGFHGAPR